MRVQSDKPAKSGGWMHSQRELSPFPLPQRRPTCPQPPQINARKLMREWSVDTTTAALDEFAASLGLSTPSVTAVGAAWSAMHAAWAFPMCDGYGNIVGIRLRNERGKFAVRGSRQGIFVTGERSQAVLFVCEGPTDTAAAVELGLFALGRPNCCCGGAEIKAYIRRLGVGRAVIISDNDKPGLDGARKVGSELKLPFAIYIPPAKDVRDFVRLGGTRAMIENTLKSTIWQSG